MLDSPFVNRKRSRPYSRSDPLQLVGPIIRVIRKPYIWGHRKSAPRNILEKFCFCERPYPFGLGPNLAGETLARFLHRASSMPTFLARILLKARSMPTTWHSYCMRRFCVHRAGFAGGYRPQGATTPNGGHRPQAADPNLLARLLIWGLQTPGTAFAHHVSTT